MERTDLFYILVVALMFAGGFFIILENPIAGLGLLVYGILVIPEFYDPAEQMVEDFDLPLVGVRLLVLFIALIALLMG